MDWEHSRAYKGACQAMNSVILTSLGVSSASSPGLSNV